MLSVTLLFSILLALLAPGSAVMDEPLPIASVEEDASSSLFRELGLNGVMESAVFEAGYRSVATHGIPNRMLAIADMTQPSTAKRLYVIDLNSKRLVAQILVAHGQGNGELMATQFSNRHGSHQTSLGLYRVGREIVSPKHGRALLLHGLDKGINDQALAREVIMHSADYVSEGFIATHGRLGRSWGCPAVEREQMAPMIDLLADGGLLYVHGK